MCFTRDTLDLHRLWVGDSPPPVFFPLSALPRAFSYVTQSRFWSRKLWFFALFLYIFAVFFSVQESCGEFKAFLEDAGFGPSFDVQACVSKRCHVHHIW